MLLVKNKLKVSTLAIIRKLKQGTQLGYGKLKKSIQKKTIGKNIY